MLAATLRRSITGRWNTMARRTGGTSATPSQVTRPMDGGTRPIATRNSVVLPEPFGPISTVGGPGQMASDTRSSTVTWPVPWPARMVTSSKRIGRSAGMARILSRQPLAGAAQEPRAGIDDNNNRDQHQAEPDRQRQIALGGFQRDGRGHGAGEAVDVTADDDDGADFGSGAAEAGQQRDHEAEAALPDQCQHPRERTDIHRVELVTVFGPQILDGLSRQRRDDRRHQDGLRHHHRGRRE